MEIIYYCNFIIMLLQADKWMLHWLLSYMLKIFFGSYKINHIIGGSVQIKRSLQLCFRIFYHFTAKSIQNNQNCRQTLHTKSGNHLREHSLLQFHHYAPILYFHMFRWALFFTILFQVSQHNSNNDKNFASLFYKAF